MVTKEFAIQIDTELAKLHDQKFDLTTQLQMIYETIDWYVKRDQQNQAETYYAKVNELKPKLEKVVARISQLNKIYNQDPWTRAFLVINSNGHVHSSMDCTTCFSSTRYTWLVQYSNDDEATIVADAGETACTICYPSAPAEVLNRPSRIVTADKLAKAQAKAERDAKREARIAKEKANAPTASGEALRIPRRTMGDKVWYTSIKTERTAVTEWSNNYYWIMNSTNEREDLVKINSIIAEALAGKHGVSVEQMVEHLTKKAKASIRRAG